MGRIDLDRASGLGQTLLDYCAFDQYTRAVALLDTPGAHVRVACDNCRVADAEVCCLRETGNAARKLAVEKLKRAGWHHDPARTRDRYDGQTIGGGRWYCPSCRGNRNL
jgi:hypothetical protein